MFRFNCLHCDKKLYVPQEQAGKLCQCPRCNETLRIPDGGVEEDSEEGALRVEPSARSGLTRQPRPIPQRLPSRRPADWEEDDQWPEDSDERPGSWVKKPKKQRLRSSDGFFANLSPVSWIFGIGGVICLLTIVTLLIAPMMVLAFIGLGVVTILIGNLWFLFVAFQDDVIQGLLCWFVPFYAMYYLFSHLEEAKLPACVSFAGSLIILFALVTCALLSLARG
jgi:hypothetical protein